MAGGHLREGQPSRGQDENFEIVAGRRERASASSNRLLAPAGRLARRALLGGPGKIEGTPKDGPIVLQARSSWTSGPASPGGR